MRCRCNWAIARDSGRMSPKLKIAEIIADLIKPLALVAAVETYDQEARGHFQM